MKTKINLILTLIVLLTFSIFAQPSRNKVFHPFTGTMVLSFEGGATYGLLDYKDFALDFAGRGSLEYYLPIYTKSAFGIRLSGGGGYLRGKDKLFNPTETRTDLTYVGSSLVYLLSINEVVFPYFSAGASYLWFNPKGDNGTLLPNNLAGVYKKNEVVINGELGFRFLLTENLTLNLSTLATVGKTDYLEDYVSGTGNDLYLTGLIGLSFSFFGDNDIDGDGVVDSKDMCPNTPRGVKVDMFGCPIDSDKDGIPDYKDECPDTPEGVKVDKKGCPIDSDSDGVPDYLDICPNTPKGVQVDEFGCPKDGDNDGIPDYLDKCPNTPIGVMVDKDGCPLDSDKDGVPDYLDKCPNTPKGVQVDKDGCPIIKEEPIKEVPVVKEVVLSAGASFAVGKTTLLPGAYSELDQLVNAMRLEPTSKWLIEGHTDNTGSYNNNKKLSTQRAQAVLEYFASKGINPSRFTVRGMGPDFPVADNTTPDGRAKNRRVTIIRVN
ncbi:MAG: OmpA family protein [Ignavibacteriaceae bacterium]|nr:OmpA family protein [Ignavibacteriaceae bacterium]HRI48080.1 OmpA family protein [Ignavibacteriaceae bacterium]